jgi:hypothetical protein
MEVIDIGLNDLEPISINLDPTPSTTSYSNGMDLLMNDKHRSGSGNVRVELDDLYKMESDLNDLAGVGKNTSANNTSSSGGGLFESTSKSLSGLFGFGGKTEKPDAGYEPSSSTDSKLGHATADSLGSNKTWEGFTKVSDIPTGNYQEAPSSAKLNEREKRRKKRLMLKKLEEWREKGLINGNSHFNMDSNYEEVEDEYETALDDKRKKDSIKLQGWWFMTFVNSVEYMNAAFNPFDLNLDGWGEQVSEDIDSYEEIFSELHEKYKGGKLSPELSLLLRLGFSAAVVNFSNKALSTATPGFNDVIKQSPELMKMFTDATVKSMSQASPGFAMANSLMNNPDQINTSFGPPPKAVETRSAPPSMRQMQYTEQTPSNRPDIALGRGAMFREQGVDVSKGYDDVNAQSKSIRTPAPVGQFAPPPRDTPQSRPEMRGPNADLDAFLSGLKKAPSSTPVHETRQTDVMVEDVDSMISLSSLKDMNGASMPKRTQSRRKPNSARNVVSLDI